MNPDNSMIHHLHKSGFLLCTALVFWGLYEISVYNYLLFHSLVEMFSIAVALAIFMMVWNSRHFIDNGSLKILGCAYLFISLIDLGHTLAFKGMGAFQGYGANLPTQLWIAARYMQGFTLLAAPFLPTES